MFHLRRDQPPVVTCTPGTLGALWFDAKSIRYVVAVACAALAVVPRCVYAYAMSLWRFAFLVLPLTNWAAAELNHPKPGQRVERGDDLALACHVQAGLCCVWVRLTFILPNLNVALFTHPLSSVQPASRTAVCAEPEFSRCDERASINVSWGISPRLTSAIFGFTVENNLLDGTSCVCVMIALSIAGQRFVARVPALEKPSLIIYNVSCKQSKKNKTRGIPPPAPLRSQLQWQSGDLLVLFFVPQLSVQLVHPLTLRSIARSRGARPDTQTHAPERPLSAFTGSRAPCFPSIARWDLTTGFLFKGAPLPTTLVNKAMCDLILLPSRTYRVSSGDGASGVYLDRSSAVPPDVGISVCTEADRPV